jgi:vacuolar iron transporter family protein
MILARRHAEYHRPSRIGWLRAAVRGANDGIVSTASLVLGVVAAGRVAFWGAVAMAVTAGAGALTGTIA